ncbi:MAG: peptidoglycan D,D-transpeptidase FtsI family protein [Candidatus Midichloria sp.]|nr:penicillin-binding protein 2 [Hyalomma marginatum]
MYWNELSKSDIYEESLKNSIIRWKFITGLMSFAFIAIILRLFDLSFTTVEEINLAYKKQLHSQHIISRADIVDRNGTLLASNIKTASVYAHPKQLIDAKAAAKYLANLKIGLNEKDLIGKLGSNKDFVWIKRHITPIEQQLIHDLGIPGVYFVKDERRIYPHENLFAHVLGYVNIDGVGIAGIERLYNNELIKLGLESKNMQLSLDVRIQTILCSELKNAIDLHSAVGGAGVIMNVNTGEILAMASLPDFNPHNLNNIKKESLFNQVALGIYEMGSTFKPFTLAMGLDTNKISLNDAFDVSKPLKIGKFQIHDYKSKGGYLSVPEILMYSSNLGVAQIAKLVGAKAQRDYLNRFGMLREIEENIPGKAKPMFPNERKWSEASLITISYGHGIAVTGIHLAQAMAALVNGGLLYKPTLIRQENTNNIECRRVIKEQTSHAMRKLLRLVVESGSAKRANVEGLLVGGKTGTAEKNKNGRYSKKLNLAIFAGAFPMNKPEYVIVVMINEAKQNSINYGYTTGGMIAAPVGGNIIRRMAQVLGVMHLDHNDKEVLQAMYLDYIPRHVTTKLAKR